MMDLIPLMATDSVISPIKQAGNFFIMESEQLVSEPYKEMQNEVMAVFEKKTSLLDKMTSVQNNVCENYLQQMEENLEMEKRSKIRHMYDNKSKLMCEVKLLEIDKRKNDIENKKRYQPERDFSYDDTQIKNSEIRLGTMGYIYYLDKKLKIPIRSKNVNLNTPIIVKARKAMMDSRMAIRNDLINEQKRSSTRATRSAPSCLSVSSNVSSMSASTLRSGDNIEENEINQKRNDRVKFPDLTSTASGRVRPTKVSFEDPFEEQTLGLQRSHTFHAQTWKKSSASSIRSTLEDDSSEKIDLRELLFGKVAEDERKRSLRRSSQPLTQGLSNSSIKPFTQDMMEEENTMIKDKISKFLKSLDKPSSAHDKFPYEGRQFPNIATVKIVNEPPPSREDDSEDSSEDSIFENVIGKQNIKGKLFQWHLKTRGNRLTPESKKTHQAEQMILQGITGVNIERGTRKSVIPMNSASRALRHTATFKMQQVVQQLMANKTKVEQLEMEQLKSRLETPEKVSET